MWREQRTRVGKRRSKRVRFVNFSCLTSLSYGAFSREIDDNSKNNVYEVAHIAYFKYQKSKIPNSRGYFRPWRIRIRGRFGPEPMQMFANSKNRIFAKIRIWCPAPHENRHSPKNFPVDVTLCVDSESVIRNMIALRNIEIPFKSWF